MKIITNCKQELVKLNESRCSVTSVKQFREAETKQKITRFDARKWKRRYVQGHTKLKQYSSVLNKNVSMGRKHRLEQADKNRKHLEKKTQDNKEDSGIEI